MICCETREQCGNAVCCSFRWEKFLSATKIPRNFQSYDSRLWEGSLFFWWFPTWEHVSELPLVPDAHCGPKLLVTLTQIVVLHHCLWGCDSREVRRCSVRVTTTTSQWRCNSVPVWAGDGLGLGSGICMGQSNTWPGGLGGGVYGHELYGCLWGNLRCSETPWLCTNFVVSLACSCNSIFRSSFSRVAQCCKPTQTGRVQNEPTHRCDINLMQGLFCFVWRKFERNSSFCFSALKV